MSTSVTQASLIFTSGRSTPWKRAPVKSTSVNRAPVKWTSVNRAPVKSSSVNCWFRWSAMSDVYPEQRHRQPGPRFAGCTTAPGCVGLAAGHPLEEEAPTANRVDAQPRPLDALPNGLHTVVERTGVIAAVPGADNPFKWYLENYLCDCRCSFQSP